jgi:glycosyltransferase involved in cell wall biosynthesis
LPSTPTSIGSRYTSPLKLFEYMAAGKAIVVSDLASIREVVTSGIDAVVVPPEPRAFAEAIDSLLADPDCRERLGRAAAERACDFSWTRRADIIARFIESAVRSSA